MLKSGMETVFISCLLPTVIQSSAVIDCNFLTTRNVGQCPTWRPPCRHRWRPMFNAAKFGWRPLLECRAVMLPRCETRGNLQGCPKLANRSQPLVGRSSPYSQDMWGRHYCLTSLFLCRYVPQLRRYSSTKLWDGAQMANFWRFLGLAFPASHVQHISDLHSKFALGPHHV